MSSSDGGWTGGTRRAIGLQRERRQCPMSRRRWQNPRILRCAPLWVFVGFSSGARGLCRPLTESQGRGGGAGQPPPGPTSDQVCGGDSGTWTHLPPHQTAAVATATVATATPPCLPFLRASASFLSGSLSQTRPPAPTSPSLQLTSEILRREGVMESGTARGIGSPGGQKWRPHSATVTGPPGVG